MSREHWRPAYVAIGSNLHHPENQVRLAFARLDGLPHTRVQSRSALYRSSPMGVADQPEFVNAVAGLLTQLPARALLDAMLEIEARMGRERRERWGPRIIDLDLVWMVGPVIDEPGLAIPHPGVSARNFVLYPLAEIAPDLHIPGHGRVADLTAQVDPAGIQRIQEEQRTAS
jgi:2-amino-4-hydroxy-6-hydroxymethyldihydropteridine diphosphokinase